MRIGELSRAAGLNPSAIRYYEEEGLIPRAERRSGRRVFDERSLEQLILVQMAKDAGFSLAEVRQLVTGFGKDRWRRLAERKLIEVQAASEGLRIMSLLLEKLLKCKCPSIEFCGRALRRHRCRTPEATTTFPVPPRGRRGRRPA